ncbi:MAG: YraN family protein [Armatimonadetes bacterium]|jgi:putative endonuclease|nr:YraN family protein [Armatimonadota bacterium]
MAAKRSLGERGEQAAAAYLERAGYRIRERNYRTPRGEIDLVAEEGETLVFVEVKTRADVRRGQPREAVGRRKQLRMAWAAYHYLEQHPEERPCRFDVVEVLLDGPIPDIHLIRHALPPAHSDDDWFE